MSTLEQQIEELQKQISDIRAKIAKRNSKRQFRCICGEMHQISQCDAIQTHFYVKPSGCTEGDYWKESELHIVCPLNGYRNRILFNGVTYDARGDTRRDPEMRFKSIYKPLFKSIRDEHEHHVNGWQNNYYFDVNRKKFQI